MKGIFLRGAGRKEDYTSKSSFKAFGYLYKLRQSHERSVVARSFTSAWSWRFFTIEKDMFKWYKNKDSLDTACGYVNFHEIRAIRVLNSESRMKDSFNRDEYGTYSFKIVAQSRELVLRCPRKIHARNWVFALRESLKLWTGRSGRETLREIIEARNRQQDGMDQEGKPAEEQERQSLRGHIEKNVEPRDGRMDGERGDAIDKGEQRRKERMRRDSSIRRVEV